MLFCDALGIRFTIKHYKKYPCTYFAQIKHPQEDTDLYFIYQVYTTKIFICTFSSSTIIHVNYIKIDALNQKTLQL